LVSSNPGVSTKQISRPPILKSSPSTPTFAMPCLFRPGIGFFLEFC
jgi:hypothetical protein